MTIGATNNLTVQRVNFNSTISSVTDASLSNLEVTRSKFLTRTLTQVAAAGQNQITLNDASGFSANDVVTLQDDDSVSERHTIASISGNTLTLEDNLVDDFDPAQDALLFVDTDEILIRLEAGGQIGMEIGSEIKTGSGFVRPYNCG